MANRPNQNWEARSYQKYGIKWGVDINNPEIPINFDAPAVYQQYGYTENKDVHLSLYSESGKYSILNDRSIEIAAGGKNESGGIDLALSAKKGDITITCMENGLIRIKGSNIMIQSDEDIDLHAGRNISMQAKNGTIKMDGHAVEVDGFSGNLVEKTVGSFTQRITKGTKITDDVLVTLGGVSGIGDVPVIGSAAKSLFA